MLTSTTEYNNKNKMHHIVHERDIRTDLMRTEKTSLKHKCITCRSNHCTGNPETTNTIQGHADQERLENYNTFPEILALISLYLGLQTAD